MVWSIPMSDLERIWFPTNRRRFLTDQDEIEQPIHTQEPTRWIIEEPGHLPTGALLGLLARTRQEIAHHEFVVPLEAAEFWARWNEHPNILVISPVIRTQAEALEFLPRLLRLKAARREAVFAPTEKIDVPNGEDFGLESWCDKCGWGPCTGDEILDGHLCPACVYDPQEVPRLLDAVRVRGDTKRMPIAAVRLLRDRARSVGVSFSLRWGRWVPVPESELGPRIRYQRSHTENCTLDGVEYPEE